MSQATELPRTEVRGLQTRQTGGLSPRDMHARGEAYPLPQTAAIFIPLCGLRKANVIPSAAEESRAFHLPHGQDDMHCLSYDP